MTESEKNKTLESEKNKTLDLVNRINIAEYEDHRLDFSIDVKNYIEQIMTTKYSRYRRYFTKDDFINHSLEFIKMCYHLK